MKLTGDRHPKTAARRGSFRAPRRVAAPARVVAGRGIHPSLLMWLQYAATWAGYWPHHCVGCRSVRLVRGDHQLCGQCRRSLTAARDAGWLSQVKRWNQERTR